MFKVVSFNANGIRSAAKKGFFDWFKKNDIDVLCVQETKAQTHQLDAPLFNPEGYFHYHSEAEKKGYSGVSIYTRKKPTQVHYKMGLDWADAEGRYVEVDLDFEGLTLTIASLYLPSGSSGEHRQAYKFKFMDFFEKRLKEISLTSKKNPSHQFILCGDWNIVHTEKDIKNFKSNQQTSGCLPEERAWLDGLFKNFHFVDAFRVLNQNSDEYSWWSMRTRAREKNIGWRIDYQIISQGLRDRIRKVDIYREENFSDHAPVIIEYAALQS